jgi:hypothetical protein
MGRGTTQEEGKDSPPKTNVKNKFHNEKGKGKMDAFELSSHSSMLDLSSSSGPSDAYTFWPKKGLFWRKKEKCKPLELKNEIGLLKMRKDNKKETKGGG